MSILILFFLISFIPVIWVNYVFKKNDTILPNMPFNGYEFGEQIIEELKLKESEYIIIGTGGFAEIINNQIPIFDKIDQNLTLDGMRIIYNLNKK